MFFVKKIGPQCALGVLCFKLVCFYSFRLEFCFQMLVSGSLTAASEKVDKPLRCLSGKCMVEYCLLYAQVLYSLIIIYLAFSPNGT